MVFWRCCGDALIVLFRVVVEVVLVLLMALVVQVAAVVTVLGGHQTMKRHSVLRHSYLPNSHCGAVSAFCTKPHYPLSEFSLLCATSSKKKPNF